MNEGLDMKKQTKASPKVTTKKLSDPDDFVFVARRLGADESRERFEKNLGKISKAKPTKN